MGHDHVHDRADHQIPGPENAASDRVRQLLPHVSHQVDLGGDGRRGAGLDIRRSEEVADSIRCGGRADTGRLLIGAIAGNSRFVRTTRRLAWAGFAVATFSIVMSGCNRAYISQESLSKIRSIDIDTDVAIPEAPTVAGPLTTTEILLGYQPANIGRSFGGYMEAQGIKVDQVVLRAFRRLLTEQGRFELRKGGDATLELEVGTYGFRMPALYIGNKRKAILGIAVTLKSKNSTVMWKQTESTIFYPTLTTDFSIHALSASPELVEKSLEEASCILAYLLLSQLHPMPQPPVVSSVDSRGELREVLLRIPACDLDSEPSRSPIERRIKCIPDVGCTYE
jgi:hypothetical protein